VSTVLDRIVEETGREVRRRRDRVPIDELERRVAARSTDDRPFSEALSRPGISIIAEHKRRSPSAGDIRAGATVAEIVTAYERGGAAALSILTEGPHFAGRLEDLVEAQGHSRLPILRKDFIIDRYQVVESAAAGADAILLIVAALEPEALAELHREARSYDLDVVVEVHTEEELECALETIDADIIGINNRDLSDFTVDIERTYALLADVPTGKTVVSESGFHAREQLDDLERVGVDAVLVGESLMRAPDPEAALRALTGYEPETGELSLG
jgi:indole-3-glycerol phosphate synthase